MFLTRTSCRKTTHANDYYGAWPGWAVSISMLPLTWLVLSLDSLVAQTVHCLPEMQETQVRSLGWEDPLEKEMATHSTTLA